MEDSYVSVKNEEEIFKKVGRLAQMGDGVCADIQLGLPYLEVCYSQSARADLSSRRTDLSGITRTSQRMPVDSN